MTKRTETQVQWGRQPIKRDRKPLPEELESRMPIEVLRSQQALLRAAFYQRQERKEAA